MIEGIAFDAYGTLYDVYSVERKCDEEYPGSGAGISRLWRQKQLEYSWLRTLMGRYVDFWHVTEDALRYTLAELGLPADEGKIEALMASYLELEMYPEVIEAMARFGARKKAILTNGNLRMIEPLVTRTGLDEHLDSCLSADEVGLFKTRPEVYQLAVDHLGIAREHLLFVSSNGWDVAGAKAFGFTVGWLNRRNLPPEELGVRADYVAGNLLELAEQVEGA
ncbi:haloacid dehalogenase type II [Gordonibacter massiliensis (ex Traore et al. 2017)]|uniref:Haloacid dehalogenase type II n=1 Tax=Gordonibacter massiliensis (ex Traore et al. 2017) TaxID=1841863 RepID=A0A842JF96_9ACTN|nr:haloacid dehalogenase type II [Gordonibacter massiliensis (ex Traore et al. 2017)]MBC2888515.1 haloacid dehalogenase type II [Gordonibacter massiliensis (ex Traore et al. 2017)]